MQLKPCGHYLKKVLKSNMDISRWKKAKLGDFVSHSKESVDPTGGEVTRYVAGEHMETDQIRISKWGLIGDGYLGPAFIRRFHPGQVLYGSRRTYLRKLAVADFDGVCANTTFVLSTSDSNFLLQEFIPCIMTSEDFHAFSIRESKGSVNPYVNWSDLAKYEFYLPSIDEQAKMIKLYWGIQKHIEAINQKVTAIQNLKESWISSLLESTVESQSLVEIADIIMGQSPDGQTVNQAGEGIPFFQGNAEFGQKYPSIKFFTTAGKKFANAGDILISVRAPIGDINIAPIDCSIGRGLASIRPHSVDDTEFIKNMLLGTVNILSHKGAGSTFSAIKGEDLRKHTLPWPEKAVRLEITSCLNSIDMSLEASLSEKVSAINLLKGLVENFKGLNSVDSTGESDVI
jgi:type I restriction enzyme S subunit